MADTVSMVLSDGSESDVIEVQSFKVDEMKAKGWVILGEKTKPAAPAKSKPKALKMED